ncbi:conserved hypothetical protein [Sulfurovum sp. enrichment culture clone C5]|uniref:BFD-like [2Fe-2S]-binding domain-containing protein n=1 Tax=Sulfurovum sp. enrichment culture clone C5 TaxID=497650 RepID=A0A0S4XQJ9_9BACT|nr:conserved hypothetical protein [Sulfurovum sp. enrichment culture clone C5]
MADIGDKIICDCGQKTINEAIMIFNQSDLPYKKAKKLVTECNKTCCRRPLVRLFDMIKFGEIDYEEIDFLIEQRKLKDMEMENEE